MRVRYILVAEGDRHFRMALFTALTRLGHGVEQAEDGREAMAKLQDQKFDLVMADTKLGKLDGLSLVREAKKLRPDMPVIAMSSASAVDEAVAAMREGALDFLQKPFPAGLVEEALKRAFADDDDDPRPSVSAGGPEEDVERPIVFKSTMMDRLLGLARSLSGSAATVLLQGESGTGKELLARYIHNKSARAGGPFLAVNCAGLPENLLESELFGHEKGAFTGALAKKPGKFDLAHGGTILLDEISEMDISLQAKLLRVLQEGEIDPVGGKGPHKIDVRVVATTNRRLKSWVDEGKFRSDLYYRLNVMPFYIPALRERAEDIEVLADFFVAKYARANNRPVPKLSPEALETLAAHDWPGNIRELENTVARAVLMTRGPLIEAHDVFMDEAGFMLALERNAGSLRAETGSAAREEPPEAGSDKGRDNLVEVAAAPVFDGAAGGADSPPESDGESRPPDGSGRFGPGEVPLMTIEEMERRLIGKALTQTSGNRTHAARLLGISVRTLRNKLAEYRGPAGAETAASAPAAEMAAMGA